jgi:hypothetical protein
VDLDAAPQTCTGAPPGLTPDDRERVLEASTALFAANGPKAVTLKWVALASQTSVEQIADEWLTVEALLADVLAHLSARMDGLGPDAHARGALLGEGEAIDVYQRIVAHSLLDGLNPASLLDDFPHGDTWAALLQDQLGLDERTVRYRLAHVVALTWGWRLFGPHLRLACGLQDESDDALLSELHRLVGQIVNLPPS